jgi:YfiH family protein
VSADASASPTRPAPDLLSLGLPSLGLLSFPALAEVDGLAHAVTTRAGGVSAGPFASLNLGRRTPDLPTAVAENRRRAAAALGFAALLGPRQVHGATVVEVRTADEDPGEADAVMTDRPGLLLGILGADCPGVLLVDPRRRALALLHAGWRGTAARLASVTVAALVERYGCVPSDLRAAIGPGISQAAYEVGPEVADALAASSPEPEASLVRGRGDRWQVDLGGLLADQLRACGVPASSIERSPYCTHRDAALFFSHRRDGERAGRHALLAGWRA